MKLILIMAMAAMLAGCMTTRIEIPGCANIVNVDMSKTVSTDALDGNETEIPASLLP